MKLSFIAAAALAFVANTAAAGAINNADFANGLNGWTTSNNVWTNGNQATLTAGWANVYSSLGQSLSLKAGDVFSGKAQFFAQDYLPYNDYASVSIAGTNLFSSNVAAVGAYGNSGLTSFQFVAPTTGQYYFWAGVANQLDSVGSSYLTIRDLAVESEVPEPASLGLLALGLLGAAAARRKKA